jgi:ribose/xylose/arabinose/galactoside ABC-type transport system permease subunit
MNVESPNRAERAGLGGAIRRVLTSGGPFLGFAFIALIFFLYDLAGPKPLERFEQVFEIGNLKLVAAQATIVAVGALGMTIVIIAGGIDLSPGSSIALGTVVVALVFRGSLGDDAAGDTAWSTSIAALAGIATCAAIGFFNGWVITAFRIVPFIVTLGVMSIARGLAKLLAGEKKVPCPESWLSGLLWVDRSPDASVWALPPGVWTLVALAIVIAVVLRETVFGRHVFAIGSNESTAVLCGVPVRRRKVEIYALSGVFVGIAAVLEFATLNSGDPSTAVGKELDIIAAVVIGGGSLNGGKGSVLGTVVGAFIIRFLRNGCVIYAIPNTVQEIVIGAIIVTAAALDGLQTRRAQSGTRA